MAFKYKCKVEQMQTPETRRIISINHMTTPVFGQNVQGKDLAEKFAI